MASDYFQLPVSTLLLLVQNYGLRTFSTKLYPNESVTIIPYYEENVKGEQRSKLEVHQKSTTKLHL